VERRKSKFFDEASIFYSVWKEGAAKEEGRQY
jgi:hypothetical protein